MQGQWFNLALAQPIKHLAPCFILVKGEQMPCFWSKSGCFICPDFICRRAVQYWRYRETKTDLDNLIER